jgi:hypothetical protein
LLVLAVGCAPATRLELRGNPRGNAIYEFRQMMWRDTPSGSIEVIGYGLIPFRNDPYTIDHNPRWPSRGLVTFWLHAAPDADGRVAIQMLGPAKLLGPGDDEVLNGAIEHAAIEASGTARVIQLMDVPMSSRNHPGMSLRLSGHLIARPGDQREFDRQLNQFKYELESRKLP